MKAADAVVIITDHDDIDYGIITTNADYVLDSRRRISGPNIEHI